MNENAESKLTAPGSAEMNPPPASVRFGSSMPVGGGEPKPMMPFSLWNATSTPGGTYFATSVGRPMPRLTSV